MAISDSQKVDYLYKKLGFGVAKTDTSSVKSPSNESIPSPLLLRGENLWIYSNLIPNTAPSSNSSVVGLYTGTGAIKTTNDGTATTNRTWLTNLTDWITTEFGATYQPRVWAAPAATANAAATGTQLFADGSGNNDGWFFDAQSGVLNFADTNVPIAVAGNVIFIEGYRYVGTKGIINFASNTGNITFSGSTISTNLANANITIQPTGTGTFVVSSNSSMMIPVGNTAQRPSSANAGMLRFNTTGNVVEWYTGSVWQAPVTSFTLITSNAQTADGSSVTFPLPVANATSAGTIVSINGIVQAPGSAYSITSGNITFTEPPLQNDTVDIRIFTTTSSITSLADMFGNTGVFLDQVSGDQIIRFKNAGTETANIKANGQFALLGNISSSSYQTGQMVVTGGVGVSGNVYVNGTLYAVAKSFLIDHPSKPDYKLQYASLEGPENGVYVRGKLHNGNTIIELPDYWRDLVDEQTITVDLTPFRRYQELVVLNIWDNKVYVANMKDGLIDCFYTVWAERKDIDKLTVEHKRDSQQPN